MFSPLPCFATLSRSTTPRKPDSRANSPVISGRPIGLIESTSISPSSDWIDFLAFTVLRHFEQIDDSQESRLARQLPSDIRQTDWLDRIHFDLTFFHTIPVADFDVGPHPYSDAASDLSAANSVAQALGEHHEESLHWHAGWKVEVGAEPVR